MAASPNPHIQGEEKRVPIHEDCNANPVELSKSSGDEVLWVSSGAAFTLTFQGRDIPFLQRVFHVPAGGTCPSGPIDPSAAATTYKYNVSNGHIVVDPQVIIRG